MAATASITKFKSETDIAVLQVQVKNLDEKFDGLKEDIRDLRTSVDTQTEFSKTLIEHLQTDRSSNRHSLGKKVEDLEKWKWMVMGGAAVAGALGFHVVSKVFGIQ